MDAILTDFYLNLRTVTKWRILKSLSLILHWGVVHHLGTVAVYRWKLYPLSSSLLKQRIVHRLRRSVMMHAVGGLLPPAEESVPSAAKSNHSPKQQGPWQKPFPPACPHARVQHAQSLARAKCRSALPLPLLLKLTHTHTHTETQWGHTPFTWVRCADQHECMQGEQALTCKCFHALIPWHTHTHTHTHRRIRKTMTRN